MRDLVLGIDCSTTAAKVVAWDRAGKAVGEGRAPLQEIRPRRGYSEQRAEGWWDASATGTVIGWHHGHRRQHLFRAIEEGIAYEHRLAMKVSRRPPASASLEHVILGGGSNSDLWCQIMADVLGAPVTRAHTAEATNLGSGILCAYGIGWYGSVEDAAASMTSVAATFQPEDRARASYEQLFIEVYRPLFLAIQPRLRQLARLRERLVEGGRT